MFESSYPNVNVSTSSMNNDKHFNQSKVYEYNNTMNRSLYYQQNQTEPNTFRNYELDYSNPLIYPSNTSYRNLLETKYQTEGISMTHTIPLITQSEKERLIEEIKRQMKRDELLSKVGTNTNSQSHNFEYNNKNDYCKVYDGTFISNNQNTLSLSRNQSTHSINDNKNIPPLYSQNDYNQNDLIKENEGLKRENEELKRENKKLKEELKEIKNKKTNNDKSISNNDIRDNKSADENNNDDFKNYLILENERLTKALNEIKPTEYQIQDTIHNIPSTNDNQREVKTGKKNKIKHKKKRAMSTKDQLFSIQSEYTNTTTNINRRKNKTDKDINYSIPNKINEYDLDNPERVKTCYACLLGNSTFYKGYHPKNCSKEHHQGTIQKNKFRSKSKNKTRAKSKQH